ncbi:hypothetical protein K493DRAFT_320393 [Basidiobolus meristosporus CBS 931.73]|uniref:Uncharacterized protein n=1 Tax=Basidiobolus meristosporus CBS 931.73 TaxID=1314790 RepID=A0A1Y1XAI7_9FUNG|nr:hypothetical protein K493DRAFT_320393 [Basidiobolus meristosporus CBS 931.73]|eukprot:ORX82750.1 hypothetical protein K493DRAFT_320393 [Basidiobolus meristosporus CBS 931.73]
MSALPPQPPIPSYLPPGPPITDRPTGNPRQRTVRAPSAPAIFGASLSKISRVSTFTRRLQSHHKENSQPSSKRNSAILPTLNEDT